MEPSVADRIEMLRIFLLSLRFAEAATLAGVVLLGKIGFLGPILLWEPKMSARRPAKDCTDMTEVRAGIDALDKDLVSLLSTRAGYIQRAMELKQSNGWPARIPDRVEEVVNNAKAEARQQGLDPELVETLWRQLIDWSIEQEEVGLSQHRSEP